VSGESRIGEIVGGRFEVLSGPHAYQGKPGCRDLRCTRRGSESESVCVGWHCCHCDEPSNYQGHLYSGRYVDGEFRPFKDGQMWLSCQPGYDEAELEDAAG
jgi:hypothetical protein